ncbi:hypothetical protein GCM10011379_13660 [Filimonas zeae]|uniref:Uncharacterized protein n=1 Tax=Filimonas zeae TaxID=1737353 RepID=A0A917ITF3_9BACT|nr:hypothetical protein GCM10011379_13660 [Filimonas zeae]
MPSLPGALFCFNHVPEQKTGVLVPAVDMQGNLRGVPERAIDMLVAEFGVPVQFVGVPG